MNNKDRLKITVQVYKRDDGYLHYAVKGSDWAKSNSCELINEFESSLTLPKKVKKKVEMWANVYPNGLTDTMYSSEEDANVCKDWSRVTCVKLTGEYEVEE